jgi:Flp pilus assembly protein TadG
MMVPLRSLFVKNDEGAVAAIFALSLVALTVAIGLAVDYSRALACYDRTQSALDAATLAASKAAGDGASDTAATLVAQKYFDAAMTGNTDVTLTKLNVRIDPKTNEVQVRVSGRMRTMIGKVIGIDTINKNLLSAAVSASKDIELGMMLDVSGSMKGGKIAALKVAAKDMVDTLNAGGPNSRKARIGIVPYSTSVNLGTFALAAKGNPKKSNSCVSERKGAHAFTDANPNAGGALGNKASNCPDSAVAPLSDDPESVKRALDQLEADGSTAGHLGIAWAWYMVSDKWRSFWPAQNAPQEQNATVLKAVVLMTDGEFNTEYESDNGKSAKQARQLCANMKAEGVTVFTVAFDAPEEAQELLSECASVPSYAFAVQDGSALKKSFGRIAQYLNDLRIAQ